MKNSEEITQTLKTLAKNLQPEKFPEKFQDALNWISAALQRRGIGFYGKLLTLILSTYFLSDLAALVAEKWIPEAPIVANFAANRMNFPRRYMLEDYNAIFGRNLFNSRGVIPGEETQGGGSDDQGGPATPTTLPLRLVGTMIFGDERRNLATIEDKSKPDVFAVQTGDEIPTLAKILKIETYKVTFINKNNGKREYVDLPEDKNDRVKRITPVSSIIKPPTASGPGIEQVSASQYVVSRLEIDKALSDWNAILTQARAFPNIENGIAAGYKIVQIVPGSVYDKLGIHNEDVITGVDGQPINDPMKAMQLFEKLKETSHLELQIKRGGRPSTITYEIR